MALVIKPRAAPDPVSHYPPFMCILIQSVYDFTLSSSVQHRNSGVGLEEWKYDNIPHNERVIMNLDSGNYR